MRKLTPKERREAALRILTGQSTQGAEARRAGVSKARMSQIAAEARSEIEGAAPTAPAPPSPPPAGAPAAKPSVVEDALRAAGIRKEEDNPLTPGDLAKAAEKAAQAPEEDYKLCLSIFGGSKAAIVGGACKVLRLPDRIADEAAGLRRETKEVLKENAAQLAQEFRKSVGGGNLRVVYGFLAGDLALTGLGLYLAWREERERKRAAAAAQEPKK